MSSTSTQSVSEKAQLLTLLEESEKRWRDVLSSVPECACGVKLNDEGWSILQIAEHVSAAEHGMYRGLELAVPKATPPDHERDQVIRAMAPNRANKLQAPAPSLPKGRWLTLAECLDAFQKSRARTMEMVRTADDLRNKMFKHPLMGELDGYQAVLVIAAHPQRHAMQIEEIKASVAYSAALGT